VRVHHARQPAPQLLVRVAAGGAALRRALAAARVARRARAEGGQQHQVALPALVRRPPRALLSARARFSRLFLLSSLAPLS